MNDRSLPKINSRSPTKYKPIEMTDESVYDMAYMFYTAEQIAERFNVAKQTVLKLHGEAFNAGKDCHARKPRMLLNKILDDFSDPEINFARMDVPTGTLIKAIELRAKLYEGFGQKTEIHHTGNVPGYDAVESKPTIIERPDE